MSFYKTRNKQHSRNNPPDKRRAKKGKFSSCKSGNGRERKREKKSNGSFSGLKFPTYFCSLSRHFYTDCIRIDEEIERRVSARRWSVCETSAKSQKNKFSDRENFTPFRKVQFESRNCSNLYFFFGVQKKEAKRRRKSEKTSIGKMDFHRQKTFKGKLKSSLRHFKATPSVKISSSK